MALYHNGIIIPESSGIVYHNNEEIDEIYHITLSDENQLIWKKQREIDIIDQTTGDFNPQYITLEGFRRDEGTDWKWWYIQAWASVNIPTQGNPYTAYGKIKLEDEIIGKYTKATFTFYMISSNMGGPWEEVWGDGHFVVQNNWIDRGQGFQTLTVPIETELSCVAHAEIHGDNGTTGNCWTRLEIRALKLHN